MSTSDPTSAPVAAPTPDVGAWQRVALTFGVALGLLAGASFAFGRYAQHHFIPIQQLDAAVAAGPGCVVVTGDSRIAAALSPEVLRETLKRSGVDVCVANLGLGATLLPTEAMAVRTYLAQVHGPRAMVLASVPESLVWSGWEDPSKWIGNKAATFAWSRPGDEPRLMDWPPTDPVGVDRLLRYETQRRVSLGGYASLLWGRVQKAQDQLTRSPRVVRNQFGNLADMRALGAEFRDDALKALAQPGGGAFSPWLEVLEGLAQKEGTPLWFVELPMLSAYEREVAESPVGVQLRARLKARIEAGGGHWLDLSHQAWLEDGLFVDGLHLNAVGQAKLSRDLGEGMAPWFRPAAPPK